MLKTIVLLTATPHQQEALCRLLKTHNPALSFRNARTLEDLIKIEPTLLRDARLIAFTTGVIVPQAMLEAFGHGAYNFHPGPPHYPGWAPAHFAIYDGAKTFGATMHEMAARVDSGPIVGVENFIIPDDISVRALEQLAYVRLGYLFWRKARELACWSGPLPRLPVTWSGIKSTRQMYRACCEIPTDIDVTELKRRIRAFDDDFRGIPFTVTLQGTRYQMNLDALRRMAMPEVDAPPLAVA
jgi:methionyl-tRNA formyltransferase